MTQSIQQKASLRSLKGKRIVVTAYDLEQSEHRGIAVYSKALIRSLKEAGAEVWLLTEFDFPMRGKGFRRLPKTMQTVLQSAQVLDSLVEGGESGPQMFWLEKKLGILSKLRTLLQLLEKFGEFIRRPRYYPARKISKIELKQLFDNPYLRHDRLDYLVNVEGILCARKIFFATQVASLLNKQRPVQIDLKGFDALLTSCPLNIQPLNVPIFVQTVHDLIPLEYAQTHDNLLGFSHRLQACLNSRRIFVSKSTTEKFQRRISNGSDLVPDRKLKSLKECKEKTLVQPPSLSFPQWISEDLSNISDLRPVSYLLREEKKKGLKPFKYLLFNSSVEARKNLLFLVKAYAESNVSLNGIRLCVTGKLKKDSYSKAVKEIVSHEPGILLTGYIDESTKQDLYLNAMALLSPSLVEGFGIPALDAACLGMQAIVSDCDSHREIQAMQDFEQYILAVNTLQSRDWASAMQAVAGVSCELMQEPAKERQRRISRFEKTSRTIKSKFESDLTELLL